MHMCIMLVSFGAVCRPPPTCFAANIRADDDQLASVRALIYACVRARPRRFYVMREPQIRFTAPLQAILYAFGSTCVWVRVCGHARAFKTNGSQIFS